MAPTLTVLDSLGALSARRDAWNDLWKHADATSPAGRAETIALWVRQFADGQPFRALVAEADGRFVAALPLVGRRVAPGLSVGSLPGNEWSPAGELLVRRDAAGPDHLGPRAEAALATLAGGLGQLPWPVLWAEGVPVEAARWRTFVALAGGRRLPAHERPSYETVRVATTGSFEAYFDGLARSHQRNIRRAVRRLADVGTLRLRIEQGLAPEEVAPLLAAGLAIEDRNWKGRGGTSVLRTPGMTEFYTAQAESLAAAGQLVLVFLELDRVPIAFEYAWRAKGVHHSFKIGYDEAFARQSPGQVRTYLLLEHLFDDPSMHMMDFMGPMAYSGEVWKTDTYRVGKLAIAARPVTGAALVWGYGQVWPRVRSWLGRPGGQDGTSPVNADSADEPTAASA